MLEVIVAKAAIHTLRAATLFLAEHPCWGTVSAGRSDVAACEFRAYTDMGALLLAIAAGLYASTKGGSTIQVMVIPAEWNALLLALASYLGLNLLRVPMFMFPMGFLLFLALSMFFNLVVFGIVLRKSVQRLKRPGRSNPGIQSSQPGSRTTPIPRSGSKFSDGTNREHWTAIHCVAGGVFDGPRVSPNGDGF